MRTPTHQALCPICHFPLKGKPHLGATVFHMSCLEKQTKEQAAAQKERDRLRLPLLDPLANSMVPLRHTLCPHRRD